MGKSMRVWFLPFFRGVTIALSKVVTQICATAATGHVPNAFSSQRSVSKTLLDPPFDGSGQ